MSEIRYIFYEDYRNNIKNVRQSIFIIENSERKRSENADINIEYNINKIINIRTVTV